MIRVFITNINAEVLVQEGSSLAQIAASHMRPRHPLLGATVNNKAIGLTYKVFQPKRISFFDITAPEGRRVYMRTVRFMLYAALKEVLPGAKLEVRHSLSGGVYCEVIQNETCCVTPGQVEQILATMRKLTDADESITREEVETTQAMKLLSDNEEQRLLLSQHGDIYTTVHTLKGHSAVLYGDLAPRTSMIDLYDLQPYGDGMMLILPRTDDPTRLAEHEPKNKMFGVFREFDGWLRSLRIANLGELNQAITSGWGSQVLQVAEALHEKKVGQIADMILERKGVKFIMIAGPSSSGKTTFSKRLAVQLLVNGIHPVNLSIDDYFVNRELTPRDENGDYDFEAVEAINVELFNRQLNQLLAGEEVEVPRFDFKQGKSLFEGKKLKLGEHDVLVIEGTHALTHQLVGGIPKEARFGIYVCPLASINMDALTRIHTTDNRLIRRMVRDYENRGYNAVDTISRWPSVRRGEDKYIYPNQEGADVLFNSALCYELSVLKAKAESILLEVPKNSTCYAEARRLLKLLSYVKPMGAQDIPPTSIIREFVGGSSFVY